MVRKLPMAIALILTALCAPNTGISADVVSVVDRTVIPLGESLRVELRVKGDADGEPDFSQLEEQFEIISRSQSSQMNIMNSSISQSKTWLMVLMPLEAGTTTIPPICIGKDCSSPVTVEVLAQTPSQEQEAEPIIVEMETSTRNAYVQAQIICTVRLLWRTNLFQASLSEPMAKGVEALVEKLGDDINYDINRYGYRYQVVERRYAILPQQSGSLTISPVRFDGGVSSNGNTGLDPFGRRSKRIRKISEKIEVEVLPRPEGYTGKQWLPAKSVVLTEEWAGNTVQMTVGEPVTRTVELRVWGLTSTQLPEVELPIPAEFKSYPDKPIRESRATNEGLISTVEQKVALIPSRTGTFTLPGVELVWWDVEDEQEKSALLAPVTVRVSMPAGDVSTTIGDDAKVRREQPVLADSNSMSGIDSAEPVAQSNNLALDRGGYWPPLTFGLAIAWLVTLLLLIKSRQKSDGGHATAEKNEVELKEREALKKVRRRVRAGDPAGTRKALLAWAKWRWQDEQISNLEELVTRVGEPLTYEISLLNEALYARKSGSWKGEKLLAAIESCNNDLTIEKRSDSLPPLYPK